MILMLQPGMSRCEILEVIRLNGANLIPPSASINTGPDVAVFTDSNAIAQMRGFQMETNDGLKNGSLLKETAAAGDYTTLRLGINKVGNSVNSAIHLRANGDLATYGGDTPTTQFGGYTITRFSGLNNNVTHTLWGNPTSNAALVQRFVLHSLETGVEEPLMTLASAGIVFYKAQSTVSDESTKTNIEDLPSSDLYDKVMTMRTIKYQRTGSVVEEVGFSANNVNDADPRMARMVESGLYTIDTTAILSAAVGAIKHLSSLVSDLADRVTALESA